MSTAYVTELTALATHVTSAQIAQMPPVAEQKVTFTTTTQSAAFNAATRFIRVHPYQHLLDRHWGQPDCNNLDHAIGG
jgi:hypothetical protein